MHIQFQYSCFQLLRNTSLIGLYRIIKLILQLSEPGNNINLNLILCYGIFKYVVFSLYTLLIRKYLVTDFLDEFLLHRFYERLFYYHMHLMKMRYFISHIYSDKTFHALLFLLI